MAYQGTFAAGQVLTAAELNAFRAVTALNGSNTVPASTFTLLTFGSGSTIIDIGGWHSESTNNSRITPTIAGAFRITGFFDSTSGGADYIIFRAKKNGTAISGAAQYSGTNIVADTTINVIAEANGSTDYFEVEGYQVGSASTTFIVQFVVEYLGPT